MEWRCFIPQLDLAEINSDLHFQYNALVGKLQTCMQSKLDVDNETRTDEYYIGADYVGLKYRSGKKMEVKLRTNSRPTRFPGIEEWVKYKLSKRNYHSEYAELLTASGFPTDDVLERNERVEVLKVRKRRGYISGKEEMTVVHPTFSSGSSHKRGWISVCFESDNESGLVSILKSAGEGLDLMCRCLLKALELQYTHYLWAMKTSFFPIISGYPGWVHCLASPHHSSSVELTRTLLLFLEHMHASQTPILPPDLFPDCAADAVISKYLVKDGKNASNVVPSDFLFDFAEFPVLQTNRLVLQEVTLEHSSNVFGFRGDFEVTKYNCGAAYTSLEQVNSLISSQIDDFNAKRSIRWGISLPNMDRSVVGPVMGMVGFNYWDRTDRRASVGFELHRELWGHGYMTEALGAVLRFGFERMGLNRIEADASVYNDKCITMLKRMGFVQEGLQREQYYENGAYHDLVQLALLRREWTGVLTSSI